MKRNRIKLSRYAPLFRYLAAIVGIAAGDALAQFSFIGACCFQDGSCTEINVLSCGPAGGTPLAVGTTCGTGTCPGACCLPDGACTQVDAQQCKSSLGEFRGFASVCADASCRDTSFTYQGRLEDASAPADGVYDLRFRLFDAATGGAQVGPTLCVDNQEIVKGLFTRRLDFGHQFATSDERHLEVEVRTDTGLDCSNPGGFIVLTPRQPLTSTPRALHAESAFALDAARGGPQNAVFVDSDGNVGVGTTSPTAKMEVAGALVIDSLGDQADALWLGIERSWVFRQQGTGAGTALKLQSVGGGGNKNFIIETTGSVGIGTTAPAAKLDVRGDIRLGSSGEFRAAGGDENLRIVRGRIVSNGPNVGSGFSVSHPGTGDYTLTFNPPFAGLPVVTANAEGPARIIAMVQVHSASTVSVLLVGNTSNDPLDVTFNFIAVGPR